MNGPVFAGLTGKINLRRRDCLKSSLNKHDGKLIWANNEIPGVEGYTSPVIHEYAGYRVLIGASFICYYGTDVLTGKLLWKVDFRNKRDLNITDAIMHKEYMFITSGYGRGSMMVKLNMSGNEIIPETMYDINTMDNHHGGVILHNDFLYESVTRTRSWFCIDFMTGEESWSAPGEDGSITFADGMLYLLEQRGTMKLIKATPEKYENKGTFKLPSGGRGMYRAHPVICGKRLYIRHADKLIVYEIGEK